MMEHRILGRTGVKVAPLALGTDNFANPTPKAESIEIIDRALDAGINLIDTSANYADGGSETLVGQVLGSLAADGVHVISGAPSLALSIT